MRERKCERDRSLTGGNNTVRYVEVCSTTARIGLYSDSTTEDAGPRFGASWCGNATAFSFFRGHCCRQAADPSSPPSRASDALARAVPAGVPFLWPPGCKDEPACMADLQASLRKSQRTLGLDQGHKFPIASGYPAMKNPALGRRGGVDVHIALENPEKR